MTQLISDGPSDLDAPHRWTGGNGVSVLMNDWLNAAGTSFKDLPFIRFLTMPGFRSLPEAQDNRVQRTGRIGEAALIGATMGKTFTVNGVIVAATHQQLRQAERSLARALAERSREGTWRVEPREDNGGITDAWWEARGRVLSYDPDGAPTRLRRAAAPFRWGFTFGIRLGDPRFLWTDIQDSGAPAAGAFTVTNQGDAPADPTLVIDVQAGETAIAVSNVTTGRQLVIPFGSALFGDGTVTVNFANRTITFLTDGGTPGSDDADLAALIPFSYWWDENEPGLLPGANQLTSIGNVHTPTMVAYWRHSSW